MAMKIKLKQENVYDTDEVSKQTAFEVIGESMAQQSQKDEADINTIVKRFGLTGELPKNVRMPTYGDFTDVTDYRTALEAVRAANEAFMRMPPHVRKRFDNSPELFVQFCSDEKNREEAIKLGLVVPKEAAAPVSGTPEPAAGASGTPPKGEAAK